jgi:hypothetical protein
MPKSKKEVMMIKLKNKPHAILKYSIFFFFFLNIFNPLYAVNDDIREEIEYQAKTNHGSPQLSSLNRVMVTSDDEIETDDKSQSISTILQTPFKSKSELSPILLQGALAVIVGENNLRFYESALQLAALFRHTPQRISPLSKTFFEELKKSNYPAITQFLLSSVLSFIDIPILPNLPLRAIKPNSIEKSVNQEGNSRDRVESRSLVLSLPLFSFLPSCCFTIEEPKKNGRSFSKNENGLSSHAVGEGRDDFFFSTKKLIFNIIYKTSEFYQETVTFVNFTIFMIFLITIFLNYESPRA